MPERKSKIPLFLGIGAPIFLIVVVLVFGFLLPELFIKPAYNFIYATGFSKSYVRIGEGKIEIPPCPYEETEFRSCAPYPEVDFYLYDIKAEENIPVSLEKVNSYNLDVSEKSPDGYFVLEGDRSEGGFFPFFWSSDDSNNYHLTRGRFLAKQINLKGEYYNFKFVAWVLNGD